MLLQLEQECLDIYRKKVEKTRKYKADLHQSLVESEAEITNIVSALGEHASFSRVCFFYMINILLLQKSYCCTENAFLYCVFISCQWPYYLLHAFFMTFLCISLLYNTYSCMLFIELVLFELFGKGRGTLKEQISAIKPTLEELRSKKQERIKEFSEIQSQIVHICAEISGHGQSNSSSDPQVNECDLTVKKLGELKSHLQELQNEKVPLIVVIWSLNLYHGSN